MNKVLCSVLNRLVNIFVNMQTNTKIISLLLIILRPKTIFNFIQGFLISLFSILSFYISYTF
jgi:hypothetical protein